MLVGKLTSAHADINQVRADEDDKHEAEQGKKAEAQAVAWFTRWFANA